MLTLTEKYVILPVGQDNRQAVQSELITPFSKQSALSMH